jgi:predicted Zn-dependent peptidase
MNVNGLKRRMMGVSMVLVLLTGLTGGPVDRAAAAQPAKIWKNQPEKIAINDHLSFIYQQDRSSEITIIHLLFRGGKRAVPLAERGLAFITSRLAVELSSGDALRELMHLGSAIQSDIEGDYTATTIKTLTDNLDHTLKLIAKTIRKPLFSGLRIGNLKRFMEHRRKNEDDIPERLMEHAFLTAFSGDNSHGYGGSIFGGKDSRKQIKRKKLIAFHQRYFNGANMVMSVSTDLDKDKITAILQKYFGRFPAGESLPPPTVSLSAPEQKKISINKDNQQVLIAFGALLPGIDAKNAKNYVLIYMLENLLGRGIGSKLWPLRSRKDLAYSLNTRFLQMKEGGMLMIYMKSENAKKENAYKALKDLLTDFYHGGITADELAVTKALSKAEFLRNSETKEQRALNLGYFEAIGLGFGFLERFFAEVDGATLDELNAYMKQILKPDQLVEVTIGPS